MDFSLDTDISEQVIFPIADTEKKALKMPFVRFTADNHEQTYYATYTAYDGTAILPKLLVTKDFLPLQYCRSTEKLPRIKEWRYSLVR